MTGYEIAQNLIERRRGWSFSAVDQALYHELGMLANRSGKVQNFSVSNEELMFNLSISKPTLIRSRESLINSGLISYKKGELKGNRKSFGMYSINDLRLKNITTNVTAVDTTNVTAVDTTNVTLNKSKTESKSKSKTESKIIPPIPPEGELSEIEKVFDTFRKAYPGQKRGLETEFNDFKKKHKDYRNVVWLLLPAIERLIAWRTEKKRRGEFTPEYARMSTWLNQRRWETELDNPQSLDNQGKSMSEIFRSISK